MPLSKTGKKVLRQMQKSRGSAKAGKREFYASINKGIAGSERWHLGSKHAKLAR